MSIFFEAEVEGNTLIVTTSGMDDNVQQVVEYGRALIRLAVEAEVRHVLCDERSLTYAIETFDIFDAARTIAEEAPKVGRIAIVCRPEFLGDGKFWETVAVNRGLQVRVDTDFERARIWLAAAT